jgi:hypothetical protein
VAAGEGGGMTRHDLESRLRDLVRQGFDVRKTHSGHWQIRKPGSPGCVVTGSTPGDWRAVQNFEANMRRTFPTHD